METKTYELQARYDARKSFYGKARVEIAYGVTTLISYNTRMLKIKRNGDVERLSNYSSSTTNRHIKEFLKQNGMSYMTEKELKKFIENL